MTTRDTWKDLARRCREATGLDRDLDRELGIRADGWETFEEFNIAGIFNMLRIDGDIFPDRPGSLYPSFTESLDAVVSLIEKTLPGWKGRTEIGDRDNFYVNLFKPAGHTSDAFARTPALALCAAYCEARASLDNEGDGK